MGAIMWNEQSLAKTSRLLSIGLFGVAFASRAVGAFLLPNAEQDGYSYAEIITRLTNQIEAGQFHISDLYGFWLPAFQIVSALVNLLVHDPLIAGKIVNVVCGTISIVLVYFIARRLTESVFFSGVAAGLILLDPLHILYSAACMTDVPHSCVVLASLWFAIRRKWLGAAIFAAVAESIRIESWALIAAIPLLQWLQERRISLLAVALLLIPPVGWLLVSYAATGHSLAYFGDRARYHFEYMQVHPGRRGFDWDVINEDVTFLLLGAGRTIFAGAIVAAVITLVRFIRNRPRPDGILLAPIIYGAAMLALLVLAYVTKSQPVWLPRYGLIFLAIGLPLFAWALRWGLSRVRTRLVKAVIVLAVLAACLIDMSRQIPTLWKVRDDFRAHQRIAAVLVGSLKQAPAGARCFSDDVAIRVLSGLPENDFLRSAFVPSSVSDKADEFLAWLHSQGATSLIFFPTEDSVPVKLFPELARNDQPDRRNFEMIAFEHSTFGPDIWLYRLR
jgi:hypothetical protein